MPGARFMEVMELMKKVKFAPEHVIIIYGANYVYKGNSDNVYKNLNSALLSLKHCKVILAGVPLRSTLVVKALYNRTNEEIMNINLCFFISPEL